MKKNELFPADFYRTPENIKRFMCDRILLNSRWYFYYKFIRTVLKYKKAALAGEYDTETWSYSSKEILDIMEKCGAKFDIEGLNNFRSEKEPVVFVSNHMSTAETMVLPGLIAPTNEVTFVVKKSLVQGNFFGPVLAARGPIVVGRTDPKKDMMTVLDEGLEKIKKGISVIIFPEGTRQNSFNRENFNSLGIKLAKKAGIKVVPIALKTDFWGNGRLLKQWGPLQRDRKLLFSFGKPISISGNGKEAHQSVLDFISEHFQKWMQPIAAG